MPGTAVRRAESFCLPLSRRRTGGRSLVVTACGRSQRTRAATLADAMLRQVLPSGGDASRAIARTRSPSARHAPASPNRAAVPATSCRPRPPSASLSAGRSSGTPAPLRPVTSTRTMPSPALTVTVSLGTPTGCAAGCCRIARSRAARCQHRTGARADHPPGL